MMSKKIIFLFLLTTLIVGIFQWRTKISTVFSAREQPNPLEIPVAAEVNISDVLPSEDINPDNIWNDLETLVGERYTNRDRELTRNYLIENLQNLGFLTSLQPFEQGINIIAKRPQDDPETETLLLAAHYDTVFNSPGADDNGSGMAVLLEIARLFASQPTKKALEIVFFDQEETGLLGSFAFTSQPENIQNLRHVIVLDMVGYACRVEGCQQYPAGLNVEPLLKANGVNSPNKGEFLVVVGEIQHRDLLESFQGISLTASKLNLPPVVPLPVPLKGILTPDVLRSDHAPFWYQNIAAVLVTDTANLRSPYYHQPSDTLANLDPEFLMGSAQVIVNVVTQLLNR